MQYHRVGLPKTLSDRFRAIQPVLGYRNFSEYVVDKIRQALRVDELTADRLIQEMVEKERKSLV